ncbi:MAG TPA: bifunctional riboflavin kinase/FAD synthetase [Methylophilus sp.]|nr:bifunctional riboflavin kinase/FAD synthetase [Methylophilus sp.]HQQ33607.1 bifunctional riboflavin kinase/FAD synthetase [Methylophilus sp.]
MQVFRHLPVSPCPPLALAIGNFDGMHLGHQALLKHLLETASRISKIPAVMTFEPHPREFFSPQDAPARLTTLREKLELLESAGVEKVFVYAFSKRFAAMSAMDFMQLLRDKLNVDTVLVGEDFRFGAKRAGSLVDFVANGFDLIAMPRVDLDGERVSSTRVREALVVGNLALTERLLGRHYSISGKVVHGAKRGRQLGFPTANIHMRHERPALTGVYAVKLSVGQLLGLNAVANLGVRPTVEGIPKLLLEVHVLDFNGDLYGQHVHVEFLQKIRDEQKFESLDALKAQIAKDIDVARDFFK